MRKLVYLILFEFLLISCGGKKSTNEFDPTTSYVSEVADTLTLDTVVEHKKVDSIMDTPIQTTMPSRDRYKPKDNMRGFDPPSEDDTNDNGMTRYMEVNDDNGWD